MDDDVELGQRARGLLHYWWLVLGLALVGALTAGLWSVNQPEAFRAEARILLRAPSSGSQFVDSLSPVAMESERQLLLSRIVLDRVADQSFNETRWSMSQEVSAEVDPDSNILVLEVERQDPEQAAQLANAVTQAYLTRREEVRQAQFQDLPEDERLQQEAQNLNRAARAEVISPAVAPDEPVSPRPALMSLAGGVAGTLLGGFGALVIQTSSGRIRSSADLRKALHPAPVWARVANPTQPDPGAYNAAAAAIAHLRAEQPAPLIALITPDTLTDAALHGRALAQALTSLGPTILVSQAPLTTPTTRSDARLKRASGSRKGPSNPPTSFDDLLGQGVQPSSFRMVSLLPGVKVTTLRKGLEDADPTQREAGPFLVLPRQDTQDPTVLLEAANADAVLLLIQHRKSSKHSVSAVASALSLAGAHISGVVVAGLPTRHFSTYED